jgi:membrane protein DedA with SNARE-associated domain
LEHLTHFFLSMVDQAGYPGLFVVMVLGNIGVPIGAELVVPAAGALSETGHLPSVWLTALVATLGEVVGCSILYAVGYFGGRPFVARWGKYLKLSEAKLDVFHTFYERHGNVVVFVCRFIPFVRGVSSLPAGVSRMRKRYFLTYTAAGSLLFCAGLTWIGSMFGEHFYEIMPLMHRVSTAAIVVVLVAIAAFVWQRIHSARRRGEVASRP